eukprot:1638488-Prymnesium_polylepis.1
MNINTAFLGISDSVRDDSTSDFEWFAQNQIKGKLRTLHPSRPCNVGDWEPGVGLLLFTRPTVGHSVHIWRVTVTAGDIKSLRVP